MSYESCDPTLQIWCGNPLCWVEGSGGELCQAFALLYQQYSWHFESFGRHEHKQLQEGLNTQLFSICPFSTACSYMVFHLLLLVSWQVWMICWSDIKWCLLQLVFSSSATVYGQPKTVPCTEDFQLTTMNPYGRTKVSSNAIFWFSSCSDMLPIQED